MPTAASRGLARVSRDRTLLLRGLAKADLQQSYQLIPPRLNRDSERAMRPQTTRIRCQMELLSKRDWPLQWLRSSYCSEPIYRVQARLVSQPCGASPNS